MEIIRSETPSKTCVAAPRHSGVSLTTIHNMIRLTEVERDSSKTPSVWNVSEARKDAGKERANWRKLSKNPG